MDSPSGLSVKGWVASSTILHISLLFLTVALLYSYCSWDRTTYLTAPVHGYNSVFEPTFILQARFITRARDMIRQAYQDMKGKPFMLRRYDVDLTVLPIACLEEIRLVATSKLSANAAQAQNLLLQVYGLGFLLRSDLHIRVLRNKLAPELYKYAGVAQRELSHAWSLEVPHTDEWVEVDIQTVLRRLVARMTARIFMGSEASRDDEWLRVSIDFSIDLFTSAFAMKVFPPWAYGLVEWFVPSRYRNLRQLATARRVVGERIRAYTACAGQKQAICEDDEPETLLKWMLDHGTPGENDPAEMAERQCVLTLASIHSTAFTASSIMFDLCTHPEWFPVLTAEIDEISTALGKPSEISNQTVREWCTRLNKLDSFFVESQRHNPVILLNPQRLAREPFTARDGTCIPAGTILTFASHEHQMDPEVFPNPHTFDPMRCYRKRQESLDKSHGYMAGQTHPNNLGFGYGNQACAGRQFAVAEIKLILARLLHEFEFKLPYGKNRPRNMHVNELAFLPSSARVMMRRRRVSEA